MTDPEQRQASDAKCEWGNHPDHGRGEDDCCNQRDGTFCCSPLPAFGGIVEAAHD